ncbi:aldo/keto reductase [Streptomyces sp. NPDC018972]|uniref:aldo/keto reductase n=1 Tax=Streptomyces sp. NPDC018972 TaxID=3365060 RepID=UPI0037AC13CD
MTTQLALGTYRCRATPEAAARAAASGAQWIDTTPNYATGRAQTQLAPALAAHPALRVSTKADYFTAATGTDAVNAGVLTADQAVAGHSVAPGYVRWQCRRNREQLGRERLDLVLLHNPERAHPGDRPALHRAIRDAVAVLGEAVTAGHVAGHGIATWTGLDEEVFTVGEPTAPTGARIAPPAPLSRYAGRCTGGSRMPPARRPRRRSAMPPPALRPLRRAAWRPPVPRTATPVPVRLP